MAPLILPAISPECTVLAMLHAGLDLEAVHALKTCNCTVPVMAAGFAHLLTGERQFKRFPRVTPIFAINGGAGAIFSRGLLQRVRVLHYERCVLGKGPPIFAKCLGELAGRLGSFFAVAFAAVINTAWVWMGERQSAQSRSCPGRWSLPPLPFGCRRRLRAHSLPLVPR